MTAPASVDRRALWSSADVAGATGGVTSADFVAAGVSIDSRTVTPGDLFVALVGPNNDAHRFVADALGRGAAAAMVEGRRADDLAGDGPLVLVEDTQAGLEA